MNLKTQEINGKSSQKEDASRWRGPASIRFPTAFTDKFLCFMVGFKEETAFRDTFGLGPELA